MLSRHVLAALAHGIAADDDLVARDALGTIDPVARGFARRRLARALVDAELATTAAGLARPPRAHLLRLAALDVAKRPGFGAAVGDAAGDIETVVAAYAALPPPRSSRIPVLTLASAAAFLAIAVAVTFAIVTRPGPASRTYARPLPAPTAAAYKLGGVPLRDPSIDQRFDRQLTELVIDSNRGDDRKAKRDVDAFEAASLGHGAALDHAWAHALDAFAALASLPVDARLLDPRGADDLREAVRELTDQLANAGLGYFLEGRLKGTEPMIQAYRVEEVVFVTAGGKPRRVLSLRRLDKINTAYAALGLFDEDVGDPTLHLERIDEYVAMTELPVLALDAVYPLAEATWLATPEGKALAAAVGVAVRREYTTALGADAGAASQIAKLLAERADIIEQWRDHLDRKHIVFSSVDNLFVPDSLLTALDGLVPHYQHERVETIDDELASLELPRIHARVHDLVVATVRRHEAQHGYDFDRDTELQYPQALAELLGPPHDGDGNPVAIVTSARAELAGYLSQVINDPVTPHAALWHLGMQTFTQSRAGTGEFYAGIAVLEGLAHELGVDVSTSRWRHGLDRERLAKLALVIAQLPDAKLREAATALWQHLFGEPPTPIVDSKLI
jgi:hypothetical protein